MLEAGKREVQKQGQLSDAQIKQDDLFEADAMAGSISNISFPVTVL